MLNKRSLAELKVPMLSTGFKPEYDENQIKELDKRNRVRPVFLYKLAI
jgi:hypothetical protein